MFKDAKKYVKRCSQCQRFARSSKRPSANLHTLRSPWPFMQWELDVVDPLPRAQPHFRFLLFATDYFTKWVKVVAISDVTGQQIVKFLWQNIVCRFGLSTIISDNETNFASRQVTSFCSKYKLPTDSPLPNIHKVMFKLRSATALSLTAYAKVLTK